MISLHTDMQHMQKCQRRALGQDRITDAENESMHLKQSSRDVK